MKIGKKIEALRIKSGMQQEDLAKKLNVSPSTLSHWENDKRQPSYDTLDEIAEIFNTSVSELFNKDDQNKYSFLNNIIMVLINEGSITSDGLSSMDETSKQILMGAVDQHIKKIIKEEARDL